MDTIVKFFSYGVMHVKTVSVKEMPKNFSEMFKDDVKSKEENPEDKPTSTEE